MQEETQTRFVALEVEDVHVAQAARYERGIRSLVEAMHEVGLGPEFGWHASQHNQSYYYSFSLEALADLDPETGVIQQRFRQLLEAVPPEAAREFAAATVEPVYASRLSILERVPDFTYQASRSVVEAPRHAIVDIHRVRADLVEQYKGCIQRLVGAVRRVEYPISWSAYRVVVGESKTFYGEGRAYYYVVPFDTPGQFHEQHTFQGALVSALGEKGAQELILEERSCLLGMEVSEHRRRPDLGYIPGQQK